MIWLVSLMALFSTVDECRVSRWKATVTLIDHGIREFEVTYGRLPAESEGLRVLVERPSYWPHTQAWLPILDGTPLDPWGRELCYVLLPEHKNRFGFYSLGADGITTSQGNDADDINSWNEAYPWIQYYDWPSVMDYFRSERRRVRVVRCTVVLLVLGGALSLSLMRLSRIRGSQPLRLS